MAVFGNSARASATPRILRNLRAAQSRWAQTPLRDRMDVVRRVRHRLAERAEEFASTIPRPAAETLTAEVLPLAEACRFLERKAAQLLAPRVVSDGTPLWLRTTRLVIHREPCGVVLVIGPGNYPLFLPGVQVLQALAAGNVVALKPGRGGTAAAAMLLECIRHAGAPEDVTSLLDEAPEIAQEVMRIGIDKVVLTGSSNTGKAVLETLASRLTPSVMELSGEDPVFLLDGANIGLAAAAIRFGLTLNQGNTCIRPRRVFGDAAAVSRLREELGALAHQLEWTAVSSAREALRMASESPYALGATIFGERKKAEALALKVKAGVVVINDMIVPTAHPAAPFGGRGASGFGVTRGAEGLLEFTTLKTVVVQRSRWLPHLQPALPGDAPLFASFIRMLHAGAMRDRIAACAEIARAFVRRRKET